MGFFGFGFGWNNMWRSFGLLLQLPQPRFTDTLFKASFLLELDIGQFSMCVFLCTVRNKENEGGKGKMQGSLRGLALGRGPYGDGWFEMRGTEGVERVFSIYFAWILLVKL